MRCCEIPMPWSPFPEWGSNLTQLDMKFKLLSHFRKERERGGKWYNLMEGWQFDKLWVWPSSNIVEWDVLLLLHLFLLLLCQDAANLQSLPRGPAFQTNRPAAVWYFRHLAVSCVRSNYHLSVQLFNLFRPVFVRCKLLVKTCMARQGDNPRNVQSHQ